MNARDTITGTPTEQELLVVIDELLLDGVTVTTESILAQALGKVTSLANDTTLVLLVGILSTHITWHCWELNTALREELLAKPWGHAPTVGLFFVRNTRVPRYSKHAITRVAQTPAPSGSMLLTSTKVSYTDYVLETAQHRKSQRKANSNWFARLLGRVLGMFRLRQATA